MKFHHINESENGSFSDPNPSDLKAYLAKLRAQDDRIVKSGNLFDTHENREMLRSITGEEDTLETCYSNSDKLSGWTRVGVHQVSPVVMSDPSLRWFIDKLRSVHAFTIMHDDLLDKIHTVNQQVQRADWQKHLDDTE